MSPFSRPYNSTDEKQKKIVKYYLDTCNRIISARMPMFEFWPYGNGLAHYYNYKKEDTYKDRISVMGIRIKEEWR